MGIIDKKNHKYNSGEIMASMMYRPNPKSPHEKVNDQIKEHLTKVVKKLIAKEYRAEALDILFHSDEKVIGEFLFYYFKFILSRPNLKYSSVFFNPYELNIFIIQYGIT